MWNGLKVLSKDNKELHDLIEEGAARSLPFTTGNAEVGKEQKPDDGFFEKLDTQLNGSPCITLTGRMRGISLSKISIPAYL